MMKLYCDIKYPHCKVRKTLNSSHKSNQSSPCTSELLSCQLECIAIRESEAQFRSLILQIPAITYISDLNKTSTSLYISPQIEELLGYTQEEYQEDPEIWEKTIYPDDRNRVLKELARNRSSGRPLGFLDCCRSTCDCGKTKGSCNESECSMDRRLHQTPD